MYANTNTLNIGAIILLDRFANYEIIVTQYSEGGIGSQGPVKGMQQDL